MAIKIPIISEFDERGVTRAAKQFANLETAGQKAGFVLEKAFVPAVAATGALAAALGGATKAAMEDQAAQVKLASSLKNVTNASDAQIKAVEKQISVLSKAKGVADDELRPAFEALTRGTKSLETTTRDMSLVMDIAYGTQRPLVDVADALAKAYQGNFKGLQQLSPEMKNLIQDGASMDTIMSTLRGTFGGMSDQFANTAEGSMAKLKVAFNEAKESIGTAFLPVVEKVVPKLTEIATWIENNSDMIVQLATLFAGVAGSVIAANTAMKAYNGLTTLTAAANTVLSNSFMGAQIGKGGVAGAIGIAILTLEEFYGLMRDPNAWYEFKKFAHDALALVVNTFMTAANLIRNAVTVVANGLIQIANVAIDALNAINPFSDIPKFTEYRYAKWNEGFMSMSPDIPYSATQNYPGSNTWLAAENRGTGIMAPSIGGGGAGGGGGADGGGGGGGGGGSTAKPQAINPWASNPAGLANADWFAQNLDNPRMMADQNITINVEGGLASSSEIGQAVVNAIRAFNRTNGPAQIAVSAY